MAPFNLSALLFTGCSLFLVISPFLLQSQGTVTSDWRSDYQTLTHAQFIEKRGLTLFDAIQKGCDANLVCEWEKSYGHGTVQHVGFFIYDAWGCSSDPQYFPHQPSDGSDCEGGAK